MSKIRVLVVDDAVVMRKLITEALAHDPEFEVAGTAPNGRIALQKISQINPDAVTMDVEMPVMDGVTTLKEIRKIAPKLPVIMFSTLTQKGAATTLDALAMGANDYVTKPANVGSVREGIEAVAHELIPKIRVHCKRLTAPVFESNPAKFVRSIAPAPVRTGSRPVEIVCIGTSTGGPNALAEVFAKLPAGLPAPVVVVQHMPPMFTAMLAQRLTLVSKVPCVEATEGMPLQAGRAYIAPGGRHMEVSNAGGKLHLRLHDGPLENSCRPSVDVLFRSVAKVFGEGTLAVVMTGMGQDGLRGCERIREAHGRVLVQDEATSVVWGMPGSVAHAGLADEELPLAQIAGEIGRRVFARRISTTAKEVPYANFQ